jgi:hypothetical protein
MRRSIPGPKYGRTGNDDLIAERLTTESRETSVALICPAFLSPTITLLALALILSGEFDT